MSDRVLFAILIFLVKIIHVDGHMNVFWKTIFEAHTLGHEVATLTLSPNLFWHIFDHMEGRRKFNGLSFHGYPKCP